MRHEYHLHRSFQRLAARRENESAVVSLSSAPNAEEKRSFPRPTESVPTALSSCVKRRFCFGHSERNEEHVVFTTAKHRLHCELSFRTAVFDETIVSANNTERVDNLNAKNTRISILLRQIYHARYRACGSRESPYPVALAFQCRVYALL